MFAAPGAPDVLTLSTFAYQVYDTYKGARKRFKDLAGDIKGLEILLRTLGNRLQHVDANSQKDSQENLLSTDEAAGLEQLVRQAGMMLQELQQKQGHALAPRGLSRFRWSQGEVDSVRSRITSLCAIIGAYNGSLVLPNTVSRVPVMDKQPKMLVRQITEDGITKAEAEQNQDIDLKWADHASETVASSTINFFMGSVDVGLGLGAHKEEIEVISAVYGPRNVTDIIRHIINAHSDLNMTRVAFSAKNETFGGDPWPSYIKAFAMVWRKVTRLEYGNLYSAPQKLFAEEDELLIIDLSVPLPYHESSETNNLGSIYILNASWHNVDVTEQVASITANDSRPNIMASTYEFFGLDPRYGHKKVMSVTWAYSDTAEALSHCEVRTVTENSSIQIPPFLDIICANWGGLDITNLVRANITPQQTLRFDTKNVLPIASLDPLPGWQKTISVLYRYGASEPMQLLVIGEGSGYAMIEPGDRMRRNFFFLGTMEVTPDIRVVAAVWGVQPVSEEKFGRAVRERKEVPCSNEFFGRDGWGGRIKTLQVFLQNEHTGEIACVSAKEGNVLEIPTAWPEH